MKLLSVNVSLPRDVSYMGKAVRTGIFKEPVNRRIMLRTLNLDGDGQADRENHGGVYKAVYAYTIEHYEHWQRELGRPDLTPGRVLEEGEVGAGDPIERVGADPEGMTVSEMNRLLYIMPDDRDALERALRIQALSPRRRAALEERLARHCQ